MDAGSHQPTIVYVNTRAVASTVVQTLERMGVVRVAGYTGEDSAMRRQHVHEMFLSDGTSFALQHTLVETRKSIRTPCADPRSFLQAGSPLRREPNPTTDSEGVNRL